MSGDVQCYAVQKVHSIARGSMDKLTRGGLTEQSPPPFDKWVCKHKGCRGVIRGMDGTTFCGINGKDLTRGA